MDSRPSRDQLAAALTKAAEQRPGLHADDADAILAALPSEPPSPDTEPLREALKRARELTEYHVPNVHTDKVGRRTVDSIHTDDGRVIAVCGGCGQEYPCDSRQLADMVIAALGEEPHGQ